MKVCSLSLITPVLVDVSLHALYNFLGGLNDLPPMDVSGDSFKLESRAKKTDNGANIDLEKRVENTMQDLNNINAAGSVDDNEPTLLSISDKSYIRVFVCLVRKVLTTRKKTSVCLKRKTS